MTNISTQLNLEATAELHGAVSKEIRREDPDQEQARKIIDAATIGRRTSAGSEQNSQAPSENI